MTARHLTTRSTLAQRAATRPAAGNLADQPGAIKAGAKLGGALIARSVAPPGTFPDAIKEPLQNLNEILSQAPLYGCLGMYVTELDDRTVRP